MSGQAGGLWRRVAAAGLVIAAGLSGAAGLAESPQVCTVGESFGVPLRSAFLGGAVVLGLLGAGLTAAVLPGVRRVVVPLSILAAVVLAAMAMGGVSAQALLSTPGPGSVNPVTAEQVFEVFDWLLVLIAGLFFANAIWVGGPKHPGPDQQE